MRYYLDYNASAPMDDQVKSYVKDIMDMNGNPSSVHTKGRKLKNILEIARQRIALLTKCNQKNVIFTSGATESAAILLKDRGICCSRVEHPCVSFWCETNLQATENGEVRVTEPSKSTVQLANSETGIIQELPENLYMSDVVQGVGKIDFFDTTQEQKGNPDNE